MSQEDKEAEKRDYVIETVEEYNAIYKAIQNDCGWFDIMESLCAHYYESEPCGGLLHIVLDDGNLEDDNISWCAGLAHGVQDHEASDIANLMRAMTMQQRERLYNAYPYQIKAAPKNTAANNLKGGSGFTNLLPNGGNI